MISVVLLPTAMFTASPLWCNACLDKERCGGNDLGPDQSRKGDMGWWVNKYCLMNEVGNAFNYFANLNFLRLTGLSSTSPTF